MVSTRSADAVGEKRAPSDDPERQPPKKQAKHKEQLELETGEGGEVGLKKEDQEKGWQDGDGQAKEAEEAKETEEIKDTAREGKTRDEGEKTAPTKAEDEPEERSARPERQSGSKASPGAKEATDVKSPPSGSLTEPKHGTLERGHIYFLYRPKIDADEVESIDDISKFHILLLPKSKDKGYSHRIIEVGKKKLPDPGAKHQVIWGLVGGVGDDRSKLKEASGAYSYETKTRGTRHQPAARPAARGHYILHSPHDTTADDPSRDRQRDFRVYLAYALTTPAGDDFGSVQREFGIAHEDAIGLQVKDPDVESTNNPRAAGIPRDRRAQYPASLQSLFSGRRWIPSNPPSFLDYPGTELLLISHPHDLSEAFGPDGDKVEKQLEGEAARDEVGKSEAVKELGMSERDTEIEALEGEWA
ncbi:hypothetical protein EHS25_004420 [Saitozyma podzolica]|uniref:Uncharacterized protein n=1 Tax=Saitozyma podzolica TaxID=1890683 RepID=A0A427YU99_9TREE|nr:hypothetical protein EHS25_004420 [Saitozyma podzolica]